MIAQFSLHTPIIILLERDDTDIPVPVDAAGFDLGVEPNFFDNYGQNAVV